MSCGLSAISKAFLPQQKIINMYIYWGKHWTEMFMALSLAVLQNNIQVKLTIYRLKEHMKFHS